MRSGRVRLISPRLKASGIEESVHKIKTYIQRSESYKFNCQPCLQLYLSCLRKSYNTKKFLFKAAGAGGGGLANPSILDPASYITLCTICYENTLFLQNFFYSRPSGPRAFRSISTTHDIFRKL